MWHSLILYNIFLVESIIGHSLKFCPPIYFSWKRENRTITIPTIEKTIPTIADIPLSGK